VPVYKMGQYQVRACASTIHLIVEMHILPECSRNQMRCNQSSSILYVWLACDMHVYAMP
jgi:hypothetical protein